MNDYDEVVLVNMINVPKPKLIPNNHFLFLYNLIMEQDRTITALKAKNESLKDTNIKLNNLVRSKLPSHLNAILGYL